MNISWMDVGWMDISWIDIGWIKIGWMDIGWTDVGWMDISGKISEIYTGTITGQEQLQGHLYEYCIRKRICKQLTPDKIIRVSGDIIEQRIWNREIFRYSEKAIFS